MDRPYNGERPPSTDSLMDRIAALEAQIVALTELVTDLTISVYTELNLNKRD